MRFSILIPVFNTEKYLEKCLQSVFQQDYNDYEVILIDDGSTDSSKTICERYSKFDKRIKFYSRENQGLLATRREQLKICSGEYILFLDSDDYWENGILSFLSENIDKCKPDMICFAYNLIEENENIVQENVRVYDEEKRFSISENNIDQFVKEFFKNYMLCNLWNKCIKKEIIDIDNEYSEFSDVYGEDVLQLAEIVCNAKSVLCLPESFYYYRMSSNGKGRNLTPEFVIDTMCVRDYMYNRILAHNLDESIKDAFLFRCLKDILHRYNCLLKMCKNYREFNKYIKAMKSFPVFDYAKKKLLTDKFVVSHDSKASIKIVYPRYYYLRRKCGILVDNTLARIRNVVRPQKKKLKNYKYLITGWCLFEKNRFKQKEIPSHIFKKEYKKYKRCFKKDVRKDLVFAQMQAFLTSSFELISDRLVQSDDRKKPTVFVVVRNEMDRMKIFFDHYRKLGVQQFVVLDNGSDDGTLEYISEQKGTRVYQVLDSFQTQKKEAWIEKLLVMNGLDRWCIVVDSDELLEYIGSEAHSFIELINKGDDLGYKRIWGYMLDMYAEEALFEQSDTQISVIDQYRYFDKNTYILNLRDDPNTTRLYDEIYGGPRYRVFKRGVALSKQAVFLFEKESLYRSCHFLYPLIKWGEVPCWFVLKHYKFLPWDKSEYERRIREKCFYNNSTEYKDIMEQIENDEELGMYYEDSEEYKDSYSLRCLPFLEEIKW